MRSTNLNENMEHMKEDFEEFTNIILGDLSETHWTPTCLIGELDSRHASIVDQHA